MSTFEKLAEKAIAKAAEIECSVDDYIEGLEDMVTVIKEHIEAAEAGRFSERGRRN